MKRILRLSIATLFSTTILAAPALAQSDGSSGIPGTNLGLESEAVIVPENDGAMVDTETTASIDTDFDAALDLMADSDAASEIAATNDVGEVRVIRISTLDNSDEARIDQAMGESEAEINELQAAVAANPTIVAELGEQGTGPEDVLAADIALDGSVIVYIR